MSSSDATVTQRGSSAAAAPSLAATATSLLSFPSSPFLYQPAGVNLFEVEDERLRALFAAGKVIRDEAADLGRLRCAPVDQIKAEFTCAPRLRRVVRVDAGGADYETSAGSGRLVHYAIAQGQVDIVQTFVEGGGDVNVLTNPSIAMRDLSGHGVLGLHDAGISCVAVAVWTRQHEVLRALIKAGGELGFGGIVLRDCGDRVPTRIRAIADVDRADVAPCPPGTRRSVLWYAARMGDAQVLGILLAAARERSLRLAVTSADIDAAKARSDPSIAAQLEAAVADGSIERREDVAQLLAGGGAGAASQSDVPRDLARAMLIARGMLLCGILVVVAWVAFLLLFTPPEKRAHWPFWMRGAAGWWFTKRIAPIASPEPSIGGDVGSGGL